MASSLPTACSEVSCDLSLQPRPASASATLTLFKNGESAQPRCSHYFDSSVGCLLLRDFLELLLCRFHTSHSSFTTLFQLTSLVLPISKIRSIATLKKEHTRAVHLDQFITLEMSPKRKRKQPRLAAPEAGEEPSNEPTRPSRLLSLPDELLDQIVSHVIPVPWHPKNGPLISKSYRDLFVSTLRVNKKLRQHTINAILRNTLWIRFKLGAVDVRGQYGWLNETLPKLDPLGLHRNSQSTASVTLSITKRPHDFFNTGSKHETFNFPYNPATLSLLYAIIRDQKFHGVSSTFTVSHLPAHLKVVVNSQIGPVLKCLELRSPLSGAAQDILKMMPKTSDSIFTKELLSKEIDDTMALIQNLDRAGRPLEASLIALRRGDDLIHKFYYRDHSLHTLHWLHQIRQVGYVTREENLERMRQLRTIHHIEYRACLAYISGANAFRYLFVKNHYLDFRCRWMTRNPICNFYGLPDHELAQLYHMRALMSAHKAEYLEALECDPLVRIDECKTPDLIFPAVKHAYIAWRLDKHNVRYAAFFQSLLQKYPDEFLDLQYRIDASEEEEWKYNTVRTFTFTDIDGHSRVWGGTIDVCCEANVDFGRSNIFHPELLWRVREISKRANVAYDQRREVELSELEYQQQDEVKILHDLLGNLESRIKFDEWGISQEDIDAFNRREKEENMWKNWSLW